MSRTLLSRLCLIVGLTMAACSGSQSGPSEVQLTQQAQQRLAGSWVLTAFTPDQDFEPAVAGLVAVQLGTMGITVEGDRFTAQGTGLTVSRQYRIMDVQGDHVELVVLDDTGVGYDIGANFIGNELHFDSKTSPWRGRGVLRRAQ